MSPSHGANSYCVDYNQFGMADVSADIINPAKFGVGLRIFKGFQTYT
jgi:hypothetical protein